jgi:poly(ADP-ribose) glycohydrolase ARH3
MPAPQLDPDLVRGAVLGAVVGDAFGSLLEGAARPDVERLARRRAQVAQPWRYTDDGAMTLAVAESLVERHAAAGPHLLQRLAARYDPARGFGKGVKLALAAFSEGRPWRECAFAAWPEGSRGNGAAVRVAPVACVRWPDAEAFCAAVETSAIVTHAHAEAIDAALVQSHAVASVLRDPAGVGAPLEFISAISLELPRLGTTTSRALDTVRELLHRGVDTEVAARRLGTSTMARESGPSALWAFLTSHETFRDSVIDAALLGGDVDSICSLVGALSGALHGARSIPEAWLQNLGAESPSMAEVGDLAERLSTFEAGHR